MIQSQLAPDVVAEELHQCEIKSVIRRFFPNGNAAAAYFDKVEKERGKVAANRLKDDCRKAWAQHKANG